MLVRPKINKMIQTKKMRNYIFLLIALATCLQLASALPFYYNVSLYYHSGDLEIKGIDVTRSDYNLLRNSGDYSIKIVDKNNEVMSKNLFQIPLVEIREDYSMNSSQNKSLVETKNIDNVFFNIYVPYRDGERIIISSNINNKELKTVKISDFLDLGKNLPDNKKDTNILGSSDNNLAKNGSLLNNITFKIIVILVLIVLILGIVYLIWKKSSKKK
jgi:hypothetical protein